MKKERDTASKVLLVAQDLIQRVGFNGFSYADISKELGIQKASIHYHFPTKEALVLALLKYYQEEFHKKLFAIESEVDTSVDRLRSFMQFYRSTIEEHSRLCLCSMLSAEVESLPRAVREKINLFFQDIENWLTQLLEYGVARNEFILENTPQSEAKVLLAVVKGAQLLSRSHQSTEEFDLITKNIVSHYTKNKS